MTVAARMAKWVPPFSLGSPIPPDPSTPSTVQGKDQARCGEWERMRVVVLPMALLSVVLAGCTAPEGGGVGPLVGNLAPDFAVQPVDREPWSLAAQRGKVVLLDLMGVNCPPCRAEMPHLLKVMANHQDDAGYAQISVDMASVFPGLGARNLDELRGFRDEFRMTWPIAPDRGGDVGPAYQPIGLPTIVIIGPDGVIRAKHSGGVTSAEQLERDIAAAQGA